MRPDYVLFAVLAGVLALVVWLFNFVVLSSESKKHLSERVKTEYEKGPDIGEAAAYTVATVFTFTVMPFVYIILVLLVVGALGFIFDF